LTIVTGFAAPMFLWLAGVALVLSAERTARLSENRRQAGLSIVKRGLEVFILAFAFRLQAFLLSPGGWPISIFRVDILNIMGPAILVAGVIWGLIMARVWLVAVYSLVALGLAMLTPIVRIAEWVNALPIWFQWHLKPAGEYTTFTLLPWAGFVFAGAAVGVLLAAARDQRAMRRVHAGLGVSALAITAFGLVAASLPTIYRQSSFWTSSPAYFAVRIGILMLALAAMITIEELAHARSVSLRPLERLGRASLFIYWVHVEIVYGYATWPLRRHLRVWQSIVAFAIFSLVMYFVLILRDRLIDHWSRREAKNTAQRTVQANL
jgi:acyltransferase